MMRAGVPVKTSGGNIGITTDVEITRGDCAGMIAVQIIGQPYAIRWEISDLTVIELEEKHGR